MYTKKYIIDYLNNPKTYQYVISKLKEDGNDVEKYLQYEIAGGSVSTIIYNDLYKTNVNYKDVDVFINNEYVSDYVLKQILKNNVNNILIRFEKFDFYSSDVKFQLLNAYKWFESIKIQTKNIEIIYIYIKIKNKINNNEINEFTIIDNYEHEIKELINQLKQKETSINVKYIIDEINKIIDNYIKLISENELCINDYIDDLHNTKMEDIKTNLVKLFDNINENMKKCNVSQMYFDDIINKLNKLLDKNIPVNKYIKIKIDKLKNKIYIKINKFKQIHLNSEINYNKKIKENIIHFNLLEKNIVINYDSICNEIIEIIKKNINENTNLEINYKYILSILDSIIKNNKNDNKKNININNIQDKINEIINNDTEIYQSKYYNCVGEYNNIDDYYIHIIIKHYVNILEYKHYCCFSDFMLSDYYCNNDSLNHESKVHNCLNFKSYYYNNINFIIYTHCTHNNNIIKTFDINSCQISIKNNKLVYEDNFVDFLTANKLELIHLNNFNIFKSCMRILGKYHKFNLQNKNITLNFDHIYRLLSIFNTNSLLSYGKEYQDWNKKCIWLSENDVKIFNIYLKNINKYKSHFELKMQEKYYNMEKSEHLHKFQYIKPYIFINNTPHHIIKFKMTDLFSNLITKNFVNNQYYVYFINSVISSDGLLINFHKYYINNKKFKCMIKNLLEFTKYHQNINYFNYDLSFDDMFYISNELLKLHRVNMSIIGYIEKNINVLNTSFFTAENLDKVKSEINKIYKLKKIDISPLSDEYFIEIFDLYSEGKLMQHCVGGYKPSIASRFFHLQYTIDDKLYESTLNIKKNIEWVISQNKSYNNSKPHQYLQEMAMTLIHVLNNNYNQKWSIINIIN